VASIAPHVPLKAPPSLAELSELERLVDAGGAAVRTRVLCEVAQGGSRLPVIAVTLGNDDPSLPAVGFFGGVHGLERIGAQVVLAHLHGLVTRLPWDHALHGLLERLRIVFVPIVNPGGMLLGTRANPAGVDLMRNAPVDARGSVAPGIGGQRLSARLPWYRGAPGESMQPESQALCSFVQEELTSRCFSISLDCHSGFGLRDRLWFPHACTREPIEHLAQMHALGTLFEQGHPQHRYVFEPQSRQYLAHGDLWDHLYLQACGHGARVFLPLTLEMGSWSWVKKNPRQLFSRQGIFNPLVAHRHQRVLRRHLPVMDFLMRAAASCDRWLPDDALSESHRVAALRRWWG